VVRDRTTMRNVPEGPVHGVTPWSINEVRSNTGLIAQVGGSFRDALFATGGLRVERNTSPTGLGELAALPMLGATAVRDIGPATIKLRSAYGKAIRPVQASSWSGLLLGLRGSRRGSELKPEEQAGLEFGADAFIGRSVVLRATRFDQKASGLVQPVGIAFRTSGTASPQRIQTLYQLQNVGDVSNTGWELQGSVEGGPWSLGATLSLVSSRVDELSPSYTGDLRPGDRMLEVPSRTIGLNASFSQGRWFASSTLARASDWINYDRLALLRATAGGNGTIAIVGSELRSFWKKYDGVTRLGGRAGVGLIRGMTLTLDGENLLDQQKNEPDNITILPGRTISAGLSIAF
ncbi:MAG: TonB-dependent receptor, partial [Gemmatimonadaceae bacterium]